ncbi:WD40 repeat domain-containing protein [Saccharospirillum sp. MSK14-1]|uniref:WD40 repeat domain-containing protein n=1 Tax=Saccharospirillum sp. MSK14-1 TaxID=1897632 RepID=UPI0011B2755A|nr:WD40 repeat domain-containing protein [Saccharospirillum sp. MSK14-1]
MLRLIAMKRPVGSSRLRDLSLLVVISCLAGCWYDAPEERWEVATQGAYSGGLSADGSRLVVGSIHQGGSYWTTRPPARQYDWNHQPGAYNEILYSQFSSDGQVALTADYYNLVTWDTRNGESLSFWTAPARIEAVDLSADGRFALLGLNNNKAVLFDTVNGGVLREFLHDGPVLSVSLTADASRALTGSEDLTARLWDVRDNSMIQRFNLPNQVTLVTLSDDGRLALLAPASEIASVWNLASRRKVADLPTEQHRLYSARFVGSNQLLLGTTHREILQYDLDSGERQSVWRIGSFWQNAFRSATVLDMTWQNDRLLVLGSDGYLYAF